MLVCQRLDHEPEKQFRYLSHLIFGWLVAGTYATACGAPSAEASGSKRGDRERKRCWQGNGMVISDKSNPCEIAQIKPLICSEFITGMTVWPIDSWLLRGQTPPWLLVSSALFLHSRVAGWYPLCSLPRRMQGNHHEQCGWCLCAGAGPFPFLGNKCCGATAAPTIAPFLHVISCMMKKQCED